MDICEMYKSGLSMPQIRKKVDIPYARLRKILHDEGLMRSNKEGINLRFSNPEYESPQKGKKREFTKEWRDNISKSKKGKGNGLSLKPSGYYEITMGENKYRSLHVVIMETHLGRKMNKNEVVHHKNGVKTDNRIENLEVMTRSEHARHHALENTNNRKRNKKGQFI